MTPNINVTATEKFRIFTRGIEISKYMYKTYNNIGRIRKGDQQAAENFVKDTSEIGIIATKMSQFLSARSDVLDEDILQVLQRLQNNGTPGSEPPPDMIGYVWYKEPIATASIANVYKGKRIIDNIDVVLKRIRPNVKQKVAEDLPLFIYMLTFAKTIGVAGAENMLEIVRECQPMLYAELDLRIEAKSNHLFMKKFSGIEWLTIPRVYEAGENYMISEYVPSKKISVAYPNKFLAKRLFELYIRMILDVGLVHADPHAGNIGIRKDGTFVLYDFGAVVDVRDAKEYIARCLKSAAIEDSDGVIKSLEDMGIIKSGGSSARLKRVIPKIKKMMRSDDFNVELAKLPEFSDNENRIFELTTRYVYLIRSLVIVQGLISYHDKEFSLTKYIKKYDDIIDDLVEIPTYDIVKELATDFLATPSSLKNVNELVFTIREDMKKEITDIKKLGYYFLTYLAMIEILKFL